jgi:exodeoxyribonuclease VII small subunit
MAAKKTPAGTEETLTYEQARDELVAVVQQLESGGTDLAEAMKLWERGEQLAKIAQGWLDGAKSKVEAATGPDQTLPSSEDE